MPTMIRKQIYIGRRHQQLLTRLANRRNVSEAELVREALERLEQPAARFPPPDPAAWDEARRFMERLAPGPARRSRKFRREDVYEERLGRWR